MAKKRQQHAKIDIVLSSRIIKAHLKSRFKELSLLHSNVVKDAREKGLDLTNSHLSVYFSNDTPVIGYPTQKHILWLCLRYGVYIALRVYPPDEFNEEKALNLLKKYFPYDVE